MDRVTWLREWTVEAVRDVLSITVPALAANGIVLTGGIDAANPEWSSGSAVVGGRYDDRA